MTLVERNIRKAAELSGLKEKYINEGMEKGLEQGLEQGLEKGLEQGLEKGLEQGLEKGLEQGITHTARKALSEGLDIEIVSRITGLTKRQLLDLKN